MKKNIFLFISIFLYTIFLNIKITGMAKQELNKELHNICEQQFIFKRCIKKTENLILQGADVNSYIEEKTPLMRVVNSIYWPTSGHLEMVKFLLKNRANPRLASKKHDMTPLHMCANRFFPRKEEKKINLEICKYLIQEGAEKEIKTSYGMAPIHFASSSGNLEIVKFLIQNGVNPNERTTKNKETPLHYAASCITGTKDTEILKYLLSNEVRADVNVENKNGVSPLCKAVSHTGFESVKILVDNGAIIYEKNNQFSPLFEIVNLQNSLSIEEKIKMTNYFLQKLPNFRNEDFRKKSCMINEPGETFLHLAAQTANIEIVKILLSKGAAPNCIGNQGNTPLHYASGVFSKESLERRKRRIETIRWLIQEGADVNMEDSSGKTPLYWTAVTWFPWGELNYHASLEKVKVLIGYGAKITDDLISKSSGKIQLFLREQKREREKRKKERFEREKYKKQMKERLEKERQKKIEEEKKEKLERERKEKEEKEKALLDAAWNGDTETIRYILRNYPKINVNIQCNNNRFRFTALHAVLKKRCLEGVKELLKHDEINPNLQVATYKFTPLFMAMWTNDIAYIKALLSHPKIDINIRDRAEETILHKAAVGKSVEIIQELLKSSAIEVNRPNIIGETPLYLAAEGGFTDKVKELLKHPKIEIDISNKDGETPLQIAKKKGYKEIVKLIEKYKGKKREGKKRGRCIFI